MKKRLIYLLMIIVLGTQIMACNKKEDKFAGDIPVLLYHSVVEELEEDQSKSMYVSEKNFESDLKYLKDKGYETISLEDLEAYYRGDKPKLPEKPVVITFDDGYLNNYENAFPLLKKHDTRAVIYLIGWSVGRDSFIDSDKPIVPHFSWEEAREMLASGLIEFGSHTYDLHNEPGLSYGYKMEVGLGLGKMEGETVGDYIKRVEVDLSKSKEMMEENLGIEVTSIAYPYGQYNETLLEVLEDLGFESGLITESQEASKSRFTIRRWTVTEDRRVKDIL